MGIQNVVNMLPKLPVRQIVAEVVLGFVLQSAYSSITDDERRQIIEHLEDGKTEEAARIIEKVDDKNPSVDLEHEVKRLCEELENCELPDADDPEYVEQTVQQELDDIRINH